MKKAKLNERLKNAYEAFFDTTDSEDIWAFESTLPEPFSDENFAPTENGVKTFLKQAFLYFPGTFLLLHYSMGFTYDLLYLGSVPTHLYKISIMAILAFAMCLFGLSDAKNPKNLAIPFSIVGVGFIMGLANIFTNAVFGEFWFVLDSGWSLIFLPFALVAGFLAKFLTDTTNSAT